MIRRINKFDVLSSIAGLILLLCFIYRENRVTCYIACIVFVIYILCSVFVKKNKLFLKYLHIFLSTLFFLLGVFICDNLNLWLGEINATTFYCGAFNILAFYYWIFYSILNHIDIFFEKITKRKRVNLNFESFSISRFCYRYGSIIIFFFGFFLFLSVIDKPAFGGIYETRLDYAQDNIGRIVNILRVFPAILSVLVIGPIINKEVEFNFSNMVKKLIIPYCPYILFLVWTGNKYGAFVELIYLIAIPFFSIIVIRKDMLWKFLKILLIVLIFLLTVLILYYVLNGNTIKDSMGLIGIRVACQGELWWKAVMETDRFGFDYNVLKLEVSNIINSIITEASNKDYGVYHAMNLFGNPAVVTYYETIGTRYTAAGIELAYYGIGAWALLLVPMFYCPIIAYITNVYINSVCEERFLAAIASARLLQITVSAMQQGDWYIFFSLVPIFFVVLLVLSQIFSQCKNRNAQGN